MKALPDFHELAELRALPNPHAHPAHWAMLYDGDNEETVGGLVERVTQFDATDRPYLQIVLDDGRVLDAAAIDEIAESAEFRRWIEGRRP